MAGRGRGNAGQAVKIVITGPFAAGKTTLIRTISEITVLSTEREVTDETRSTKRETTVAMDFGRISIDRDLVLYLFGTPGQERFDFMWDVVSTGTVGYVLLVDPNRPDSMAEAAGILQAFRGLTSAPYVVAVNRHAELSDEQVAWVREQVGSDDWAPVIGCVATDRESVKGVLLELLYTVLDRLDFQAVS